MWDYEKAVSHATRIMKKRFLMLLAAWDCWKAVSRACVWDYEKAVFGWVWDYEKAVSLATRIMKKRFFMLLRWEWDNGKKTVSLAARLGTQQKLWCKNYDTGVNGGLHHAFTPVLICRVISTPGVVILPPLVVILTLFNWCYVQTLGCNFNTWGCGPCGPL